MSRRARVAPGGLVYHALNRAAARLPLFHKAADYAAFERVMAEAMKLHPTRLLAYCLMPNHWHLVLWPRVDGELSAFVGWLSLTHAMRYRTHYHDAGAGHLYQQRYKSFPVQEDAHFLKVARYVERNALRANLVQRAQDWRWGSLWRRIHAAGSPIRCCTLGLSKSRRGGWRWSMSHKRRQRWTPCGGQRGVARHTVRNRGKDRRRRGRV